ncbi:MAG: hypothetical protein PR2021_2180 [Candidatus Phytoplasma pruni]|nr:MAG: hypothetical protein PR2021_2180 [Candidatus Phytoplasma pruni]
MGTPSEGNIKGTDYFRGFAEKASDDKTQSFFVGKANLFHKSAEHTFEFHFKGPKYLLELDQDCFIYPVNTPINVRNNEDLIDTYKDKTYYLYLNPVRKTLSLYTEKFNTGGEYKYSND